MSNYIYRMEQSLDAQRKMQSLDPQSKEYQLEAAKLDIYRKVDKRVGAGITSREEAKAYRELRSINKNLSAQASAFEALKASEKARLSRAVSISQRDEAVRGLSREGRAARQRELMIRHGATDLRSLPKDVRQAEAQRLHQYKATLRNAALSNMDIAAEPGTSQYFRRTFLTQSEYKNTNRRPSMMGRAQSYIKGVMNKHRQMSPEEKEARRAKMIGKIGSGSTVAMIAGGVMSMSSNENEQKIGKYLMSAGTGAYLGSQLGASIGGIYGAPIGAIIGTGIGLYNARSNIQAENKQKDLTEKQQDYRKKFLRNIGAGNYKKAREDLNALASVKREDLDFEMHTFEAAHGADSQGQHLLDIFAHNPFALVSSMILRNNNVIEAGDYRLDNKALTNARDRIYKEAYKQSNEVSESFFGNLAEQTPVLQEAYKKISKKGDRESEQFKAVEQLLILNELNTTSDVKTQQSREAYTAEKIKTGSTQSLSDIYLEFYEKDAKNLRKTISRNEALQKLYSEKVNSGQQLEEYESEFLANYNSSQQELKKQLKQRKK